MAPQRGMPGENKGAQGVVLEAQVTKLPFGKIPEATKR